MRALNDNNFFRPVYNKIIAILFFLILGCNKDSIKSNDTNSSINMSDYGHISGNIISPNWEINTTNAMGLWSPKVNNNSSTDVYKINYNSEKSPFKSPLDSKRKFEFELNLTQIEKNKIYTINNPDGHSMDIKKNWMYFSFTSLTPDLKYTNTYTKNKTPLIVKIDNITDDPTSSIPIVEGSIKGCLINIESISDSISIDLKFKSKHVDVSR